MGTVHFALAVVIYIKLFVIAFLLIKFLHGRNTRYIFYLDSRDLCFRIVQIFLC